MPAKVKITLGGNFVKITHKETKMRHDLSITSDYNSVRDIEDPSC